MSDTKHSISESDLSNDSRDPRRRTCPFKFDRHATKQHQFKKMASGVRMANCAQVKVASVTNNRRIVCATAAKQAPNQAAKQAQCIPGFLLAGFAAAAVVTVRNGHVDRDRYGHSKSWMQFVPSF